MDYKNTLMDYVRNEFARNKGEAIKEDQDLLSSGLIDSLGILKLVSFIEERFAVQIPGEDVVYENFNSVDAMSQYLASKE